MKRNKDYEDYWTRQLTPLTGGMVSGVVMGSDIDCGEENYYGLRIVYKSGKDIKKVILWFLRDEEGNGPGRFELQEVKEN